MADDRLNDRARTPACGRGTDRKRGADAQGLGRSRGRLSTKIHAVTDALGNPVRLLFRPGQRTDITRAHELVEGFEPEAIIANKRYDADHLRGAVLAGQAKPVIPPKSNRQTPIDYDKKLYKERSLVEWFFNKLNQFCRVATRYDKLLVKLSRLSYPRRCRNTTQVIRHYGLEPNIFFKRRFQGSGAVWSLRKMLDGETSILSSQKIIL
jgi:putative transposase